MRVGPMYPHFSLGIPTRDFILLQKKKSVSVNKSLTPEYPCLILLHLLLFCWSFRRRKQPGPFVVRQLNMDETAEGAGIESAAPEDGPAPTSEAEMYVSRSFHFFKKMPFCDYKHSSLVLKMYYSETSANGHLPIADTSQ